MKNTLVLFKNANIELVNSFSNSLRQGFIALGYDIFDFDLADTQVSLGILYERIQHNEIKAMIGFNSNFFGFATESGANVWETLGIPCINILLDHPFWYHTMLTNTPSTGVVLCIDRNHMNYVSRFYPNVQISGFLPHGGTLPSGDIKAIEKRSIDVIYAGSLYIEDKTSNRPSFEGLFFDATTIIDETIDFLINNPGFTIEEALEKHLNKHDIKLSDDMLRRFISSCVFIERIVSSHFREKILRAVAESGLNITIYGSGWDNCKWITLPSVTYGGMISPEDVVEKMNDSKIILNSMPWFKDGSHERLFNGMLSGGVVASETNPYIDETFPEDSFVKFEVTDDGLKKLTDTLKDILDDNEALRTIAEKGYKIASNHTWNARARELHNDLLALL